MLSGTMHLKTKYIKGRFTKIVKLVSSVTKKESLNLIACFGKKYLKAIVEPITGTTKILNSNTEKVINCIEPN
jgi:hypothetical protein